MHTIHVRIHNITVIYFTHIIIYTPTESYNNIIMSNDESRLDVLRTECVIYKIIDLIVHHINIIIMAAHPIATHEYTAIII